MDTLTLLTSSFGSEPVAVDPVRGQKALRFLQEGWRDAVVAQLSAGWRALEAKVPDQAKAIKLLSDTAAEQANAATLSIYDTMIAYIADNIDKPLLANEREEAKSVLAEMKQALSDRQGSIDPSSSKAFALLDQILGAAPVSAGVSLARKTLVGKIQKRGREYEENIRLDYLKRLNEYYNKWIDSYQEGPLLIVNVDKNKFAEHEEDFGQIIQKIDSQLYGLF